jgi:hypothetical protein
LLDRRGLLGIKRKRRTISTTDGVEACKQITHDIKPDGLIILKSREIERGTMTEKEVVNAVKDQHFGADGGVARSLLNIIERLLELQPVNREARIYAR